MFFSSTPDDPRSPFASWQHYTRVMSSPKPRITLNPSVYHLVGACSTMCLKTSFANHRITGLLALLTRECQLPHHRLIDFFANSIHLWIQDSELSRTQRICTAPWKESLWGEPVSLRDSSSWLACLHSWDSSRQVDKAGHTTHQYLFSCWLAQVYLSCIMLSKQLASTRLNQVHKLMTVVSKPYGCVVSHSPFFPTTMRSSSCPRLVWLGPSWPNQASPWLLWIWIYYLLAVVLEGVSYRVPSSS